MTSRHNNMMLMITLLIFTGCIKSLKLLELYVPTHVQEGTRAHLSCRWALGPSEHLYSVKWYKDGKEFFRHVPTNQEPLSKFKLPGVEVEESDSFGSNLTLSPVSLESSGRYRCEVSGEKPLFPTVSNHTDMAVLVLPDHGPILSGLHPRYKIGERLEVKCTSGRSIPASKLRWYINGEPAPMTALRPPSHQKDIQGYEVTSLTLHFIITETNFIDSRLKVKCLATLYPFYWKSNEESALKQRNHIKEIEVMAPQTVTIKDLFNMHKIRTVANSGNQFVAIYKYKTTHEAVVFALLLIKCYIV